MMLVNNDATVSETPANGSLSISGGAISVVDPTAGCVDELVLSNQVVASTRTYDACDTLTAGSGYEVHPPGDVTFRAGSKVVLESGFAVLGGASLTIEIAPPP